MIDKCGRKWRFRRAPLREMQWMAEIYHSTDTYTHTQTQTHTSPHLILSRKFRDREADQATCSPSDVTLSLAPCGKGGVEREATHIHES